MMALHSRAKSCTSSTNQNARTNQPTCANTFLRIVTSLFLSSLLCISGCAMPKWFYGEGFNGPNADLGKGLRGSVDNGQYGTGVDERAREIERNLGFKH